MASFMQRFRHAVYGDADPSNISDAIRNVGQIGMLGRPADPEPFRGVVTESAELDPDELPWELRDDDADGSAV